jgi:nucleoside-diphosphate-sugar epimerase
MLAFQEPETVGMVELWPTLCARAAECRRLSGVATVVVPARSDRLFSRTYPAEQYAAEHFMTYALNALAREAGLGQPTPALDIAFGPFALDHELAAHWLSCDSEQSDAQLVGLLRAWRAGAAVVTCEVPYCHPPQHRAEEEGRLNWILKRQKQLDCRVSVAQAELAAELEWRQQQQQLAPGPSPATLHVIVVTGAAGNLGLKLSRYFLLARTADGSARFRVRLADREPSSEVSRRLLEASLDSPELIAALAERGELVHIDLSVHSSALDALMAGAQTVVHMAARHPYPDAGWADAAESCDIHALVVEAAVRARVGRLLLASSNHVLGNHLHDGVARDSKPPIGASADLRPGTEFDLSPLTSMKAMPYAVAKVCGERICACAARSGALEVVIIRIGWCQPGENHPDTISVTGSHTVAAGGELPAEREGECDDLELWFKNMWLSNADLERLYEAAVCADLSAHPERCIIVNGMSANRGARWDLDNPIGYEPVDDIHST